MKKIICVLTALTLFVSASGCMNQADKGDEAKTVLKLGLPSGAAVTPMEIVEDFKAKHPGIVVEIDETPWSEFKTKLKMQIAAGNAPATFIVDSGYMATLGGLGAVVDLTERLQDISVDDYSESLFAARDAQGGLWGIPHGINPVGVYYNKTMLDEAGVAYPQSDWTFDDMFEMASKLTDASKDQYGLTYSANITEGWLPFITATGGAPLDETRTKSMFKDQKTIEGLKRYIQPVEMGIAPSAEWILSNGNNASAFYMNKVGLMIALAATATAINKNAPEGFEYDVQMLPIGWDGQRHCVYVSNLWAISARASDAEQGAAWEWIKHFIGEESQKTLADTLLAGYPIKHSALEYLGDKQTTPENVKVFYEGIESSGVTLFENKTFEEWRPKADTISTNMRNGTIDFDAGIEELDAEVTKALQGE